MPHANLAYEATSRLVASMQPYVHLNVHPIQHSLSAILHFEQQ